MKCGSNYYEYKRMAVNSNHHTNKISDLQIAQPTEPTDHFIMELDMPVLRDATARGLLKNVPTCGWISTARNKFHT